MSRRREFACVKNFFVGHGPDVRLSERKHGHGPTFRRYKLDFIRRVIAINVDDGAQIARLQPVFGDAVRQDHRIEFTNHIFQGAIYHSGYAVTKRGFCWLVSMIHTVRT